MQLPLLTSIILLSGALVLASPRANSAPVEVQEQSIKRMECVHVDTDPAQLRLACCRTAGLTGLRKTIDNCVFGMAPHFPYFYSCSFNHCPSAQVILLPYPCALLGEDSRATSLLPSSRFPFALSR